MIKRLLQWVELGACILIEQFEPDRGIKRDQGFILRVNAGNVRRELFEQGDGCRLVIDEYPGLSGNFAPQNEARVVRVQTRVSDGWYIGCTSAGVMEKLPGFTTLSR